MAKNLHGGHCGAGGLESSLIQPVEAPAAKSQGASVQFELHGVGAHRALHVQARGLHRACQGVGSGHDGARLACTIHIPPELLFDPYELASSSLASRGVHVSVHGPVDLEACAPTLSRSVSVLICYPNAFAQARIIAAETCG